MCGITGLIHYDRERAADLDVVARMTRTLRHRGPDDSGFFAAGPVALGFQRLSIVDLASGNQPLFNEDRSLALVCNGEIFNHQELRRELERRGHRFGSRSDVEVILHLYEEDGIGMLRRLNGQFAFGLYDRRDHSLTLARDPFGVNPLHYATLDGELVFGSEIKALLAHPRMPREVDLTGLDQVLSFPGLVSPRTMFKGIASLKPGHYLQVRDGATRLVEYWDLDYPHEHERLPEMSEGECVERLRELFLRSVALRLAADVEVGYYLSGGLDSSLIAAAVAQVSPGVRRKSFSIAFAEGQATDLRNQRWMASTIGNEHHEIAFDGTATADRLAQVIFHCECPIKETYNTCALALSDAARSAGIPVVLTGEGADELFAGYVGYRFDQFGRREAAPFDLATALEDELREMTWGSKDVFYEHDLHEMSETKRALYSPHVAASFDDFDCLRFELVNRERLRGRHPLHSRAYLDFKLRLSDHLLGDHGDRMALANSVEARHPFLDVDLVEFSTRIPPHLKLNQLTEKYILRRVASGLLPPAIAEREKFGWFAPGTPELLQAGVPWVNDLLAYDAIKRRGYFNPEVIEALRKRYARPGFRLNLPYETDLLAVVLTFNLWLDQFDLPALN